MNKSDLVERDKNIINNWYIACLSHELPSDRPLTRVVYDKSYVFFRDQAGKPVCLLNRCLHRLTQMDKGRVINGTLACPYHGWRYDNTGSVIEVPSEGPNQNKKNMCSKSYPCIEQDGVIWIWVGDKEPTPQSPPWRFPHANDPNWVSYFMITDFNNEVTNLCENFMDVPHTVYVHKGWFRDKAAIKVPMKVETKNGRVLVTYDQEKDKIGGIFHRLLNPKGFAMKHTDEYIYPNITRVDYTYGDHHGFIINSQNTPVSTLRSRVYTYISYRIAFGSKLVKPFISYYTRKVIDQDVDIMEEQYRSLKLDPTPNFRSTDADALHVEIERLRAWGKNDSEQLYSYEATVNKDFWI